LKTTSIHLMIADIPLFYMIYSIAYAAFSYSAGKLSDTVGTAKVLVYGYVFLLVSYLMLGYAESAVFLGSAFAVMGVFSAATDATERAWTGRLVPFEHRGAAYGLFQAAVGFGALVAGVAGGWLWQAYSPAAALLGSGGLVAIGLVVLLISIPLGKRGI